MSKHWKADEALTVLSYLIIMVAHYILFLLLYVSVHECGGTRVCACAHVCGGMHMEASKQSQIPFCLKCCSPFLWSGVSLAQGLLARLNWLPASSKDLPASASPAEILSACTPAWLPPPPPQAGHRIGTQAFMLAEQALYGLNYLPGLGVQLVRICSVPLTLHMNFQVSFMCGLSRFALLRLDASQPGQTPCLAIKIMFCRISALQ